MNPSERPVDIEAPVPPPSKEISLKPFQEVRGRLKEFGADTRFVYIELSPGTLRFELDSPEATICRARLEGNEGQYVSTLRTGDSGNQIVVVVEDSNSGGQLDDSRFGVGRGSQDGHS